MRFIRQKAVLSNGIIKVLSSRHCVATLAAFVLSEPFRKMQEEHYGFQVRLPMLNNLLSGNYYSKPGDENICFILPPETADIRNNSVYKEKDIATDKILDYLFSKKYSERSVLLISSCVCAESVCKQTAALDTRTKCLPSSTLNGLAAAEFSMKRSEAEFLVKSFRSFMDTNKSFSIYPGEQEPLDASSATPFDDEVFFETVDNDTGERKHIVMYDYSEIAPLISIMEKCLKEPEHGSESYLDKNTVLNKDVQ